MQDTRKLKNYRSIKGHKKLANSDFRDIYKAKENETNTTFNQVWNFIKENLKERKINIDKRWLLITNNSFVDGITHRCRYLQKLLIVSIKPDGDFKKRNK